MYGMQQIGVRPKYQVFVFEEILSSILKTSSFTDLFAGYSTKTVKKKPLFWDPISRHRGLFEIGAKCYFESILLGRDATLLEL